MKYKDLLHQDMLALAKDSKVRFIGYNTLYGHQGYGTLKGCEKSCIEMPVAENLMMGLAMGLSLEGFKPVVFFERSNFLLPAADAIINHLYAMPKMSKQFDFPVILRVVIPHNDPFEPGLQHMGDLTNIISNNTEISVIGHRPGVYAEATKINKPICIVEYKKLYEQNCIA